MTRKSDVRPITYLKNHAADLIRSVAEEGVTYTITQNGEAKVVVMDVAAYDRMQDALVLLKLLAHAEADIESGRTVSQTEAFDRARRSLRDAATGPRPRRSPRSR